MPIAYWCVLVAALLPLAFVGYAKAGSRNNNAPRDEANQLTGPKRRAYAAHQNGYENFPLFAAAVIIAVTQGGPIATINNLAMLYILLRVVHGLLYITDKASARSAVYGLALIANIAIFLLPAFK